MLRFLLFGSILLCAIPIIDYIIYQISVPISVILQENKARKERLKMETVIKNAEYLKRHYKILDEILEKEKKNDDRKK